MNYLPALGNQNQQTNNQNIKQKALELGFSKVGIARVEPEDWGDSRLQNWLNHGYYGGMEWMKDPRRQDIRQVMPEVRSLICVALNYYTPHQHHPSPEYAKISRYGWGRDYHKIMHKKLKALSDWLEKSYEGIKLRFYADTGPIQDKVWAQKAGIGWIAKNANVITREFGSWVFLGEILTDLDLEPDQPHTAHCGTCTRCIDACPTQAIASPGNINANLCIAYHTIENRQEELPATVKSSMQGWVAGCDICQDVCPWNQRFAQPTTIEEFQPYPGNLHPKLVELATITDEEWDKKFPASALRRIKPAMLRRNARANLDPFPTN